MNWTKYFPCMLTLGLGGCSSEMKQSKVCTNLCLTDSLLRIISVNAVRLHDVTDELILNGRVTFNRKQVTHIYPMFGGAVAELRAEVGDCARKGDILAVIRSGEVADYEKQMKKTNQQAIIACRDMDVTQGMFDSGLASDKDALQVRQELASAKAEENRIEEIFSINYFGGRSFYKIKSSVSDFIVDKKVSKDMQLRSDQSGEIFIVSGLENVRVVADACEGDIGRMVEGAPVHIAILAYPGKISSGSIDKVYHMLDTGSKTMNVRIKLCNKDCLLKPGMFTNVGAECKLSGKQMPRIDAHALIFEGGENCVVIMATDHRSSVEEIGVCKQLSKECYVRSGFLEDDRVLNQDVLLVYNALNAD